MTRAVTPGILLCAAALAAAAPVPREDDAARMRRLYGTPEDAGGSRFQLHGEKLRVLAGLPDAEGRRQVALAKDRTPAGAAFVWRDVRGDFTVSTRVVFAGNPGQDRMAGLVVWRDAENYAIVFRHGARGEKLDMRVSRPKSWSDTMREVEAPPDGLFLRLRHRESRGEKYVTGEYSHDGKTWLDLSAGYAPWDAVKVGVFVKNRSETGSDTVFDEYNLTPAKK